MDVIIKNLLPKIDQLVKDNHSLKYHYNVTPQNNPLSVNTTILHDHDSDKITPIGDSLKNDVD